MSRWPCVAVVGGSIGGLTAALVLRALGCRVAVYERSSRALQARGAGIGLHPMTVRYFTEHAPLDLGRVTLTVPWLRFLERDGSVGYEEEMNYRFSSWNTIYRSLLGALPEDDYHLGRDAVGFDQDAAGVTLRFADGERARAEMVVFADGIGSTGRRLLQPQAEARYAGYVAWRGTAPESALDASTFDVLHDTIAYSLMPSGHVLTYPIPSLDGQLEPGQRLANFVWYHNYAQGSELDALMTDRDGVLREVSVPPGGLADRHVEWARAFAAEHMAPQIAEVIARTAEPFVQVIFDIEVERMAFDRVCVMGDGAFAVRPHAAAGTAKACADAWALADALREADGEVAPALRAWEPGQLALGRQLLERTRDIGDRSQFEHSWVPGDPSLRFGLYGPGE